MAVLPILSGQIKRKRVRVLSNPSWMMKTLYFRMTQTNVNTRQRIKGTPTLSVFTNWCQSAGGNFTLMSAFNFFPFSVAQRRRKALAVMKMFLLEMTSMTRAMTRKQKGLCEYEMIGRECNIYIFKFLSIPNFCCLYFLGKSRNQSAELLQDKRTRKRKKKHLKKRQKFLRSKWKV